MADSAAFYDAGRARADPGCLREPGRKYPIEVGSGLAQPDPSGDRKVVGRVPPVTGRPDDGCNEDLRAGLDEDEVDLVAGGLARLEAIEGPHLRSAGMQQPEAVRKPGRR